MVTFLNTLWVTTIIEFLKAFGKKKFYPKILLSIIMPIFIGDKPFLCIRYWIKLNIALSKPFIYYYSFAFLMIFFWYSHHIRNSWYLICFKIKLRRSRKWSRNKKKKQTILINIDSFKKEMDGIINMHRGKLPKLKICLT